MGGVCSEICAVLHPLHLPYRHVAACRVAPTCDPSHGSAHACACGAQVSTTGQCSVLMCTDPRVGMDMALAFVARHNGEEAAQQVAGYLEYSGDFRWPLQRERAYVVLI